MGVRALLADTAPLSNPPFRRLWSANIVTVVGAQLTVVAVPAQIYAITGSSAYVGLTGRLRARAAGRLRPLGRRPGRRASTGARSCGHHGRPDPRPARRSGHRRRPAPTTCGCCCALRGPAGVLRDQPADPQRRAPAPAATRTSCPAANSLNMTVMQAGRDRRTAGRRGADPGARLLGPVRRRHGHAVRDAVGRDPTARAADRGCAGRCARAARGAGRIRATCAVTGCC